MKKLLSLFLLSLVLINCFQPNAETISIDKEYFLVGTLSDYMGREKYEEINNRVDRYSQSEKPLYLAVDSMFSETYPDLKQIVSKNESSNKNVFELYSKSLANLIDKFYTYTPSDRMHVNTDLDTVTQFNRNIVSESIQSADTIYTGRLNIDRFKTDSQKISFITGAFVRFGEHNDSTYSIRSYNSLSKVKVLTKLLKEIKCDDVEYKIRKGYIPVAHTVYFSPTSELKNYFKNYIHLGRE